MLSKYLNGVYVYDKPIPAIVRDVDHGKSCVESVSNSKGKTPNAPHLLAPDTEIFVISYRLALDKFDNFTHIVFYCKVVDEKHRLVNWTFRSPRHGFQPLTEVNTGSKEKQ